MIDHRSGNRLGIGEIMQALVDFEQDHQRQLLSWSTSMGTQSVSESSNQASQTESDGSDLDESRTARRQALIIASQAAVADQPAKGTLDLPAMTLDVKAAFGQKL